MSIRKELPLKLIFIELYYFRKQQIDKTQKKSITDWNYAVSTAIFICFI